MKRQEIFEALLKGIHKGECVIVSHNQNWSEVKVQHELDAGIKSAPTETYTIGQAISIIDGWEKNRVAICGTIDMSPNRGDAPMVTEYVKDINGMPVDGAISKEYPLPHDTLLELDGMWQFRFYVESTAGGGASWSSAGIEKAELMEKCGALGVYSTLLTGVIEHPVLFWESHWFAYNGIDEPAVIEQNYLRGFNPFTKRKVLAGYILQSKEKTILSKLIAGISNLEFMNFQKGLELVELINSELNDCDVKISDIESLSPGYHAELKDHQCLGGRKIAVARVEGRLYMLVYFHASGWIVSPGHVKDPIKISPGYYLLRHDG